MMTADRPAAGHIYPWFGFDAAANDPHSDRTADMTIGSLLDLYARGYKQLLEAQPQSERPNRQAL